MRYELMLPHQIRTAIAENWPVVLPLGVLEYHGEHMAVGMDTLAVVKMLELIEKEIDIVILPPFYYGAASYAVEPPEGNGSVQVDGGTLAPFAEALFFSLLRVGFRNIHAIIHHQTENFAAGMPTDLAFKSAGRQAIFRFIERESGEGWWGNEKMAAYYAEHAAGNNPFNWVQGASADDARDYRRVPVRPCRPGRDVADDGALPRGGRHAAVRREQGLVHGERQGCVGRAWRQGTRHDPRASQDDSEGVTRARSRRAGGRAHSARRRTT